MHCLNCGYSLKGLRETKCPECGRELDLQAVPGRIKFFDMRLTGIALAGILPVALGCVVIAGGHGVGILGFFVLNLNVLVGSGVYAAAVAVAAIVRSDFVRRYVLLGCFSMALTAWVFAMALHPAWLVVSLITSLPFLLIWVALMLHLVRGFNRAPRPTSPR